MTENPLAREQDDDIAALRAQDTAAFDRLYARYAPRVMGFALRLVGGNRAEAEDLTQETFLAAYSAGERFARRAHSLPYLLGITWRRWRDKGRPSAKITIEPLNEETVAAADPTEPIADTVTLNAALQRLAPTVQQAILLTAVQGLTYAEAAQILGVPVGTVKWRVHEGTREMRRLLNAAEERYEATQPSRTARSPHPARCR